MESKIDAKYINVKLDLRSGLDGDGDEDLPPVDLPIQQRYQIWKITNVKLIDDKIKNKREIESNVKL